MCFFNKYNLKKKVFIKYGEEFYIHIFNIYKMSLVSALYNSPFKKALRYLDNMTSSLKERERNERRAGE